MNNLILVDSAALKMALNALRRNVEERGLVVQGEIADELEKTAKCIAVDYDNALNEAGWAFLMASKQFDDGPSPGWLVNNVKTCLIVAIEKWLEEKGQQNDNL